MMKHILLGSALTASFLVVGCGGGSTDTVTTATTDTTGYVVDSAIENLDYDCVADGITDKVTGKDGAFTCQNMNQVRFRVGDLVLGEITSLPDDHYVLPQDIAGVSRDGTITDPEVTAMARLLQSLDSDGDPTNGITIPDDVKDLLPAEDLDPAMVDTYLEEASINPEHVKSEVEAQNHLRDTTRELIQNSGTGNPDTGNPGNGTGFDINNYPITPSLTPEVKETIIYMGNEERLAYDVYTYLYNYHAEQGNPIMQLTNIANNAERNHISIVQSIVHRYNLDASTIIENPVADSTVTLDQMPSGKYGVPQVQAIYDLLIEKGIQSKQDALEAGCMVEVTDINDLNADIAVADAAGAEDIVAAYNVLRDGSYSHYWSFDKGLKNMGVTDGCCSLGDIDGVNYCHPEYPQNENGGGNGMGHQ